MGVKGDEKMGDHEGRPYRCQREEGAASGERERNGYEGNPNPPLRGVPLTKVGS
jgi:hypothetical protein